MLGTEEVPEKDQYDRLQIFDILVAAVTVVQLTAEIKSFFFGTKSIWLHRIAIDEEGGSTCRILVRLGT